MEQRTLGADLRVSALGYGAMVLVPGMYGGVEEEDSVATLRHARRCGRDLHRHVRRLRRRRAQRAARRPGDRRPSRRGPGRDEVGHRRGAGRARDALPRAYANEIWVGARGERAAACAEASAARLGVEAIDLWYVHFPQPGHPIEDTVGGMAEQVRRGLVRHIGPSNVTAEQLRARMPCTRSPPSSASTRRGRATWRPTSCRHAASSASGWSPGAPGDGLPRGQRGRHRRARRGLPPQRPALQPGEPARERRPLRAGARVRGVALHQPGAAGRSRGSCTGARTSSPSRAPAVARTSTRTPPPGSG